MDKIIFIITAYQGLLYFSLVNMDPFLCMPKEKGQKERKIS